MRCLLLASSFSLPILLTTALSCAPARLRSTRKCKVKGKSNNEDDDDPWRKVSAADLAAVIDRALIEDREEAPTSGRVFVPIGEVSLRSSLLAAASGDEDTQAVADTLLEGMGDIEETVSRFTDAPPSASRRNSVARGRFACSLVACLWLIISDLR
jgi:hypothetical protein